MLPKDLLRSAAQLSYASAPGLTSESKFDLNRGLLYLLETISRRAPQLREDIAKRIGGRGTPNELTWDTLILYWEVLAQEAATVLQKPERNPFDELLEEQILSGTLHIMDPWQVARSAEEMAFKTALRSRIPLANGLYDARDYKGVVTSWAELWDNPYFSPAHKSWKAAPFFALLIQGALIDLAYAHIQLIGTKERDLTRHLTGAFEAARRVLSVPPYAMSGPSDSTLAVEDARYGNQSYATFTENVIRFLQAWSPETVAVFGVDISLAQEVQQLVHQRQYEVQFILGRHAS